jgi:DNA polymerase-1
MSILEAARKAYQKVQAMRNGHAEPAPRSSHLYDINDRNDKTPSYLLVRDPAGLTAVAAALGGAVRVAVDLETTGLNPQADRVRLLSLAADSIGDRIVNPSGDQILYLVDCFAVDPSPLWEVLSGKELVLHNAGFDLAFLARLGFTPSGTVKDTMLLAQLLNAGTTERATLVACCDRYLGRAIDKAEQKSDWSGDLSNDQLDYAARDVEVLAPLLKALAARVQLADLDKAAEIESRCLPAMVWMAQKGVALDTGTWRSLARAAAEEADRLSQELHQAAPTKPGETPATWNWNSPRQVIQAMKLAGCELKDTTDETLASTDHPLARLLRRYRLAQKRVTTYGANWLSHVATDGRVYPSWRQLGAASGRMSCGDPNMQQLPRGEHRRCVVAPPGRVLVKADFSQIELRIAAKVSGDEALLEAYRQGEDLHARTACDVLGVGEVTDESRRLAKALNFGLLYGMGANGFRQYARSQYGLSLTENEARRYRNSFFNAYPGLFAWHARVRSRRAKESRTLAGRRRLFDDRTPDTQRLNTPVQGTGADGLKLALALLWERRDQCPSAFPVLAVHDEIVVEADAGQAETVASWLKKAMIDGMAPLIAPVPVDVKVSVGATWAGGE